MSDGIQKELEEIRGQLILMGALLQNKLPHEQEDPETNEIQWRCESCRSLLGIYDQENDLMRIKRRDLLLVVRLGEEGFIRTFCPRCGKENVVDYTE